MKHQLFYISLVSIIQVCTLSIAQPPPSDATVMLELKKRLIFKNPSFWSDPDPCKWEQVKCINNKVKMIEIGDMELTGSLPASLNLLSELQLFEVMRNNLTGPLPKFPGTVQTLSLNDNLFTEIPVDFFQGMGLLETVNLDNNPFNQWTIPETLKDAVTLKTFSAISANVTGPIPGFLGAPNGLANLTTLHLSFNHLEGGLPIEFASSKIQSLWLNGWKNESKLGGPIDVLKNMTSLTDVWLQGNQFTGPIPDVSALVKLEDFDVSDNLLTGPVPVSLMNLFSLKKVGLSYNLFQGKKPVFWIGTIVDDVGNDYYCLDTPGIECDRNVNLFLKIAEPLRYPIILAENWIGNNVCNWEGILCNGPNNVTEINFQNMGLAGTIAPGFSQFPSLQRLYLSNNTLTGTIPEVLVELPSLVFLDVSFNDISGPLPRFRPEVVVKFDGTKIVV